MKVIRSPERLLAVWLRMGFGLLLTLPSVAQAGPVAADHIEVELVAAAQAATPGQKLAVALKLEPDPGWHTYWQNPGDSGLPTRLYWSLPEGVRAGPIQWPLPERQALGPLTNYGYSGTHLLPLEITVPADYGAPTLPLRVDAEWLVCADICIPGSASLELDLPVAAGSQASAAAPLIAAALRRVPQHQDWPAQLAQDGDQIRLQLQLGAAHLARTGPVAYFPVTPELVANAVRPELRRSGDVIEVRLPPSEFLSRVPERSEHVLVFADGVAIQLGAQRIEAAAMLPAPALLALADTAGPAGGIGWPPALLLAFAGGLLLNLMPCVFPVLSIKAMAVARSAADAPRERQRHALAYSAGVVLSFALLALTLLTLRSAGQSIGWGFQLQSPAFVTLLFWLMTLLGLSLSGAYTFGTRLMGLGESLTRSDGDRGAFFTGVLACIVATPCTAPFMGPAMGYALIQPAAVAVGIFIVLGLGMALPFLLLGFVPAVARGLPRPGPWMLRFKELMAFPLYATGIWLLWILGRQAGLDAVILALLGLVLVAFALWVGSLPAARRLGRGVRAATVIASITLTATLLWTMPDNNPSPDAGKQQPTAADTWQTYSAGRVTESRAEGQAVFVNLTADWCVTCKINERVALEVPEVIAAMDRAGIQRLKGDWTRRDATITALLEQHGRAGVPLYLLYPADPAAAPQVLPQILTPGIVLGAIRSLSST